MSNILKAHLALFAVALIYGANYSIAKEVLDQGYMEPLGFILLRVLVGVLLFTLFQRLFTYEKIQRSDYWRFALCGFFGVAINQMFFFMGLKLTNPINASLLMTTTPILVLVISSMLIKERITWIKLLGIILGASGAVMLIVYGHQLSFQATAQSRLGDLMVFINASSFGVYLVLVKSLMKRYHPMTVVRWVFTFGILFVIPFGAGDLSEVVWSSFSWQIWLAVIYVLVFTTFFAYLLNAYALVIVNPSVVSIYIYLQPLFATLIALLMAKDQLSSVKVLAGILIFIGVYLVSYRPGSKKETKAHPKTTTP